MNKYQEAIHDLKMAVEYPKSKYNDSRLIDLCFENIQELVEKATPKKVIKEIGIGYEGYYDTIGHYETFFCCPNCKVDVLGRGYCDNCGQALDWSNCDE